MSHMCGYRELDSHRIELARSRGTADAPTVLLARMAGDNLGFVLRTARVGGSNPLGESADVSRVCALAQDRCALSRAGSWFLVIPTFLFREPERREFNE